MLKFVVLKSSKHSITFRNYTVTYCQILEEDPWLLRLTKPKNRQKFSKNLKKDKFYQRKLLKFVILENWKLSMANKFFSVKIVQISIKLTRSHVGGFHRGADGEGVCNRGVGEQ